MMGRSYTSKGAAPVPFEFELDGVGFVMPGGVMLLDLCDLARNAEVDVASPRGQAAIADVFRTGLGEEYQRFADHCRKHHTDPDTLLEIMSDLVEHVVDHPTRRSESSSLGPLTMNGGSRVDLSGTELLTEEKIAAWRAAVAAEVTRTAG